MLSEASKVDVIPVWWLIVLATPTSLSANTTTTAIPSIAESFGLTVADATWLATAFGWGSVVGIPLVTAVMQRFGMRGAVRASAALVAVGTVVAVATPWFWLLLVARATQAAAAGAFVTIAVMSAGTARRTGAVSASIGLVGAAGPLVGAALTDVSWRLPLATSALAVLIVPRLLRHLPRPDRRPASEPVDVVGVMLVLAAVTGAVFLSRNPLPAALAVGVAATLLAAHVRRRPGGFIPAAVIRDRVVVVAAATSCAVSTTYFALLYLVPRTMEEHWSRTGIGVALLLALGAGSLTSLMLSRSRSAAPRLVWVAVAAAVLAVAARVVAPWPGNSLVPPALAVLATTAGFASQLAAVAGASRAEHRRSAASLVTLTYTIGGALGPAIASRILG